MRVASHRDAILEQGISSIREAQRYLQENQLRIEIGFGADVSIQIRQLRDQRLTYKQIGAIVGISDAAVLNRLRDPEVGNRQTVGGRPRNGLSFGRQIITDHRIEGMAIWLAGGDHSKVDDLVRRRATDALRAAFTYKGSIG
jgi:hypothetical protein